MHAVNNQGCVHVALKNNAHHRWGYYRQGFFDGGSAHNEYLHLLEGLSQVLMGELVEIGAVFYKVTLFKTKQAKQH